MNKLTPKDVHERLRQKAVVIQRFFSSPDGQEVLGILDDEFARGPMFSTDPLQMAYNLGARDVVIYLQQLVRLKDDLEKRS